MARPRIARTLIVFVLGIAIAIGGMAAAGQAGLLKPGASHVDSTTIKNSFNDIAELATEEYSFTDVGKKTKDDAQLFGVNIPFTGNSFLLTYSGTVKAGIRDISQVEVTVDDNAKTITICPPQVEILDASIDPSTAEVYDQTFNPISQISVDDVTSFLAEQEDEATQDALDGGVLDKARSHTEEILVAHVHALVSNSEEADYAVNVEWPTE